MNAQLDGSLFVYQVQFPNDQAAAVPERFIKVRCLAPIGDPLDALTAVGFDSQYIHDRRVGVLQHVVKGRANARSFAGLLSASVDLYPHQLAVVQRVTEDALQRYILADEVGLGKTIEAAAVIRQHLLESPNGHVLILAPKHLVGQWQTELKARFHLDDFEGRVTVLRHGSLTPGLSAPSLLVVDEVHHLVSRTDPSKYDELGRLAREAPRVLLLSATPVLDDHGATLRLFHLIDPVAYPLENPEAFAGRVERRREIGRVLLILASDDDPVIMSRAVDVGRRTLPDDPDAIRMLDELEDAADAEDRGRIGVHRARLREYLSDTYRLSKRLVRSRRRDLADRGMFGRHGLVTIESLDDSARDVVDALEDWRSECASHIYSTGADRNSVDSRVESAVNAYRTLMDATAVGGDDLVAAVEGQILRANKEPIFPDEDAFLARLKTRSSHQRIDVAAQASLVHLMLRNLGDGGQLAKLVVFASSTAAARTLAENMPGAIGVNASFLLSARLSTDQVHALLWDFERLNRPGVLITDRTGEDGLNLQFAHAVLHLDLPTSVMRMEQRMGRLDRIGRGKRPIRQRVVVPSVDDASPWVAWYRTLCDGFKVFSESVADLQFDVDKLEREVFTRLLLTGTVSAPDLSHIEAGIQRERDRLDEQYALDSDELADADSSQDLTEVAVVDRDDEALGKAMSDWWERTIGLGRDLLDGGAFRLTWDPGTRLPELPWRESIKPCLGRPMTYQRGVALADLGVRLIRTGSPLVDTVPGLLRYDDRGSAFATWRHVPEFRDLGQEWIIFKFVYVIEADVAALREERSDSIDPATQRRIDRLAPPWIETIYLDTDHRRVIRDDLLALVREPYSKADRNLGSRQEVLFSRIPQSQLDDVCRNASGAADGLLEASVSYLQRRRAVLDRAKRQVEAARTKIDRMKAGARRLGERRLQLDLDESVLLRELELAQSIGPRLDTMGIFILSGDQIP
jgi:ATP-dependent helicase HepA